MVVINKFLARHVAINKTHFDSFLHEMCSHIFETLLYQLEAAYKFNILKIVAYTITVTHPENCGFGQGFSNNDIFWLLDVWLLDVHVGPFCPHSVAIDLPIMSSISSILDLNIVFQELACFLD
jgi:hypothetical protein